MPDAGWLNRWPCLANIWGGCRCEWGWDPAVDRVGPTVDIICHSPPRIYRTWSILYKDNYMPCGAWMSENLLRGPASMSVPASRGSLKSGEENSNTQNNSFIPKTCKTILRPALYIILRASTLCIPCNLSSIYDVDKSWGAETSRFPRKTCRVRLQFALCVVREGYERRVLKSTKPLFIV